MVAGGFSGGNGARSGGGPDSGGAGVGRGGDVDHQVADLRQCQGPAGLVLTHQHAQSGVAADLLVDGAGVRGPDRNGRDCRIIAGKAKRTKGSGMR